MRVNKQNCCFCAAMFQCKTHGMYIIAYTGANQYRTDRDNFFVAYKTRNYFTVRFSLIPPPFIVHYFHQVSSYFFVFSDTRRHYDQISTPEVPEVKGWCHFLGWSKIDSNFYRFKNNKFINKVKFKKKIIRKNGQVTE